jgi:hypothetical protein
MVDLRTIFGIFNKTKRRREGVGRELAPPLTELCTRLSAPANLLSLADSMTIDLSSSVDKRPIVLSLVVMAAAGHFVGRLRWDPQKGLWEGSERYLRDANLDVITAEAIVWIQFLMGRFWTADLTKHRENFERVGPGTFSTASKLALAVIKDETGFDFEAQCIQRRMLYLEAMKEGGVSFEPFATIVLRSIGRRSLAEPLRAIKSLPPWTPLALNVSIFFSTAPQAFYETFQNLLKEWSDRF